MSFAANITFNRSYKSSLEGIAKKIHLPRRKMRFPVTKWLRSWRYYFVAIHIKHGSNLSGRVSSRKNPRFIVVKLSFLKQMALGADGSQFVVKTHIASKLDEVSLVKGKSLCFPREGPLFYFLRLSLIFNSSLSKTLNPKNSPS